MSNYKNKEAALKAAKTSGKKSSNITSLSKDRLYLSQLSTCIFPYDSNGKTKFLTLGEVILVQNPSASKDFYGEDINTLDKSLQEYLDQDVTTLKERDFNTPKFYFMANSVLFYSLVTGHYLKAFVVLKKIFKFYQNVKSKGTFESHRYTYLSYSLSSNYGYYYSTGESIADEKLAFEKVKYLTSAMIVCVRAFLDSHKKLTREDKSDVTAYIDFFKTEKQLSNFAKILESEEILSEFHSWIMNRKDVKKMISKSTSKLALAQYLDPSAGGSRYYSNDNYDELLLVSLITSDEGFIQKLIYDVHENIETIKNGYYYRSRWEEDTYSEIHKIMKIVKKQTDADPKIIDDIVSNMKVYLSSTYGMGLRYAGIKGDVEAIRSILEFLGVGEKLYDVVGDLPEKIQRYTITALIG